MRRPARNDLLRKTLTLALLADLSMLTACDVEAGEHDGGVDAALEDAGTVVDTGEPLTEAQSAAVISAIDAGEIAAASLVPTRASATSVKDFAERMIADHTAAQQQVEKAIAAGSITPEPSVVSVRVEAQATMLERTLTPLSGSTFDRTYMDSEVLLHQQALDLIDTRLLPTATGEFRTVLVSIREEIAEHLALAKSTLADL